MWKIPLPMWLVAAVQDFGLPGLHLWCQTALNSGRAPPLPLWLSPYFPITEQLLQSSLPELFRSSDIRPRIPNFIFNINIKHPEMSHILTSCLEKTEQHHKTNRQLCQFSLLALLNIKEHSERGGTVSHPPRVEIIARLDCISEPLLNEAPK